MAVMGIGGTMAADSNPGQTLAIVIAVKMVPRESDINLIKGSGAVLRYPALIMSQGQHKSPGDGPPV
ncbi:hypothetical protein SKAU_G00046290 [Synaphobranchus kaupii]|uniref:Uncharacterized protein n=1 Tax=Synaphobranchus kaupii TaxID=118154 RepID=A0A9Q1G353_SYNKA|nr:hypothetical protein SKAU_G00046290 [Synaphobranchus kaupii]